VLEAQHVAKVRCGQAHKLGPQPGRSALRIDDVQVHVRLVSDPDLVGGAKADEYPVDLPD
jgi:hypothetical protein